MGINFRGTVSSLWERGKSIASNVYETAKAKIEGLCDNIQACASSAVNGDVIGINANKIPEMQAAIKSYVNGVQKTLDDFAAECNTAIAFAGEHAAEIKNYIGAVSTACDNIVSNMLYFYDRLGSIKKAFEERDTKLSSEFQQNGTDLKSQFQEYKVADQSGE